MSDKIVIKISIENKQEFRWQDCDSNDLLYNCVLHERSKAEGDKLFITEAIFLVGFAIIAIFAMFCIG